MFTFIFNKVEFTIRIIMFNVCTVLCNKATKYTVSQTWTDTNRVEIDKSTINL